MGHLCGTARRHPPRGVDRWCAHRALHLLRSRASADLERQVESELVIRLLEGTWTPLPWPQTRLPQQPLRVIAVRAHRGTERHASLLLAFKRDTTGFGWARSRSGPCAGPGRVVACCRIPPSTRCCPAAAQRWGSDLRAALPAGVIVLAGDQRRRCCRRQARGARQEADERLALHEVLPTDRRKNSRTTPPPRPRGGQGVGAAT